MHTYTVEFFGHKKNLYNLQGNRCTENKQSKPASNRQMLYLVPPLWFLDFIWIPDYQTPCVYLLHKCRNKTIVGNNKDPLQRSRNGRGERVDGLEKNMLNIHTRVEMFSMTWHHIK